MASYAVKKRTDGKKKHYYWNDYRFEGGKIVKYLMKLLAILNISVSEWNSCENIKQEEVL